MEFSGRQWCCRRQNLLQRGSHARPRIDIKTLTRLPGVGKKSAERILLELKDKVKLTATPAPAQFQSGDQDEAAEALEALGYTAAEIANVFKAAPLNATFEQLVKFALTELNRLGR